MGSTRKNYTRQLNNLTAKVTEDIAKIICAEKSLTKNVLGGTYISNPIEDDAELISVSAVKDKGKLFKLVLELEGEDDAIEVDLNDCSAEDIIAVYEALQ